MKDYTPSKEECELAVKASHAVGTSLQELTFCFGKDGPIVCEVNSNAHFKIYKPAPVWRLRIKSWNGS